MGGSSEEPFEAAHEPGSLVAGGGEGLDAAEGDHGAEEPGGPVDGPRRRWPARAVFGFVGILLVAAIIACFVQIPYYAITPGKAIDVGSMITVPSTLRHAHKGAVLMTDVDLVPLRAIDYPFFRWNGQDQVVPSSELTGPATSSQYDEQGIIDMVDARQAATVVALSTLGYHVRAVPAGAIVYEPLPSSPAAHLPVGDVITAVDGRPTATLAALHRVLSGLRPGAGVHLSVRSFDTSPDKVSAKTTETVQLELGATTVEDGSVACVPVAQVAHLSAPPAGLAKACIGIVPEQAYRTVGLPFKVSIDSEGIIGPSAGLAFTLGLLDALDKGSLTNGRRIAATGTMSIGGQVGDVGGVAQKTVAVERAGATVFFVPPPEYEVAKAHAGAGMAVVAVSSLHQAVGDLEHMGGHLRAGAAAH